jgi:hypothetical protein
MKNLHNKGKDKIDATIASCPIVKNQDFRKIAGGRLFASE